MNARSRTTAKLLAAGLSAFGSGCAAWRTPIDPPAGIHKPYLPPPPEPLGPPPTALPKPPEYPKAPVPAPSADAVQPASFTQAVPPTQKKPELPPEPGELIPRQGPPADGVVSLSDVLSSLDRAFPLLLAVEQERGIAAGQRLAAEGPFDLTLRGRGSNAEGTFGNSRVDFQAEQRSLNWGTTGFAGYRVGYGDFPIYGGGGKTADGGEFRAGVLVPLLRDGPIDRQRAALRQAQIAENLADPTIRRAKLDFTLAAARAYWNWVGSGERYAVAFALAKLADDRQAGFERQFREGAIAEFIVVQNRVLIANRQGELIAARRRLEQAAFDLSLFLRDDAGRPVVPPAERLPRQFLESNPPAIDATTLTGDVQAALAARPELERFRLLKERAAVDLRLAGNQALPNISAGVAASQDVGNAKKTFTGTGPFATDRALAEVFLVGDVPVQRREANGRAREVQARLAQLLAQERFEADRIAAQVQDAVSNLERTAQRLQAAKDESTAAVRVAQLERVRFREGGGDLLAVNLQELAAATAATKVVDALADYYRALAEYRVTLGREPGE